jgi:hypothetical protein
MIIDSQNEFSVEQAVTATAISTNVYDNNSESVANVGQALGVDGDIYLVVQCDETATAGGAATLTVTLESAENAALSTNPVVHFSTGALALAALEAGQRLVAVKLPQAFDYKRYMGIRYTVATGPLTAGKFSAFLAHNVNANKPYKSGFSVQ